MPLLPLWCWQAVPQPRAEFPRPNIYQSLSPNDQALVTRGQILGRHDARASGSPGVLRSKKRQGAMRNGATEPGFTSTLRSAIRLRAMATATRRLRRAVWLWLSVGYGGGVFRTHHGAHLRFMAVPSTIRSTTSFFPPTITYPSKLATFSHGRVVAYPYFVPGSAPQCY